MGNKICFWDDICLGHASFSSLLPRLYNLSFSHNVTISSLVSSYEYPHS